MIYLTIESITVKINIVSMSFRKFEDIFQLPVIFRQQYLGTLASGIPFQSIEFHPK